MNVSSSDYPRDRFHRFTERAKKSLAYAQEEAQRLQHNYIGTEHLLLGLVRDPEGLACKVLNGMGVELTKVRHAVLTIIGSGDRIVLGEIGLTPRAKKVIELAVDETRRLNHSYVGTEHILLGLVREGEGIAAGVLESLGANKEKVREQVLLQLNTTPDPQAQVVPHIRVSSSDNTYPPILQGEGGFTQYAFTRNSHLALQYAFLEAVQFRHTTVAPEHILLGIKQEYKNVATALLQELGADLAVLRSHVEKQFPGNKEERPENIHLSPLSCAYLHLAADEAQQQKHASITTTHILLGLIRERTGPVATLLTKLNIDLDVLRTRVLERLQASDEQ